MSGTVRSGAPQPFVVDVNGIAALIAALTAVGYDVIGPVVRDGAIDYDRIDGVGDLPVGWSDTQAPGAFRLERRSDEALFQYASTAQSWKRLLHPPTQTLLTIERTEGGLRFTPQSVTPSPLALLGVRACDLHAMDRLQQALEADPAVAARRAHLFIVAVNCGRAVSTCFCTSMGTGPRVTAGFDLAVTEIVDGDHRFLIEVGSEPGARLASRLDGTPATAADRAAADRAVAEAARQQEGRHLHPETARDALLASLAGGHWDRVAERCTACGACTMVCPTCFCSTVVESSDPTAHTATRTKVWDSCFSQDFTFMHGGRVRSSGGARYRQWITHKLAYWHDQFDTSGCVGCGRCITWCPVGIDIVDETHAVEHAEGTSADDHP